MNKIKAFIYALTSLTMFYLYCRAITLQKQNKALQMQITEDKARYEFRIAQLEKEKQNALEIKDSNDILERAVKEDILGFNWEFNISDSDAIVNLKRLHDNRI